MNETEKKVAEFFVQREGSGILKTLKDIDFIEEGIIDSLDIVSLAVHIERNFKIKLDLTKPEVLKAVRRFDSLVALVQANHK